VERAPYSNRSSANKIWFVRRARGDCAIEAFLAKLDDRTLAATAQLFDRTELHGAPHNTERFRHLRGDVYEFKVHRVVAVRYLAFRSRVGWVIVFAQPKPKPGELSRLIAEAQRVHDLVEGEEE
jgi:hypothetical protein